MDSQVHSIVVQPTTLCNLNCSYCYLPDRLARKYITLSVLRQVAKFVEDQDSNRPVAIIWHGGEPLATGMKKFIQMLEVFEPLRIKGKIVHHVQTNATLITENWCDVFEEYQFRVGVSIDGPKDFNTARVNWAGAEAYEKILQGINLLKSRNIEFSVIAVIGKGNINRPQELLRFFLSLGCNQLGINIEEKEGVHAEDTDISKDAVIQFWKELFLAWRQNSSAIDIREFRQFLSYAYMALDTRESYWTENILSEYLPTVAHNGDVYLLSPELAGMKSERQIVLNGEKGFFTQKPKLTSKNEFNLVFIVPDIDKKIKRVPSKLSPNN